MDPNRLQSKNIRFKVPHCGIGAANDRKLANPGRQWSASVS